MRMDESMDGRVSSLWRALALAWANQGVEQGSGVEYGSGCMDDAGNEQALSRCAIFGHCGQGDGGRAQRRRP